MNELETLISAQWARWPAMEAVDALKLLYQREFGCGHLVTEEAPALARLAEEWASTPPDASLPLAEPIGGGFVRLHLAAAKAAGLSPALVARLFFLSAAEKTGEPAHFLAQAEALAQLAEGGALPCSAEALRAGVAAWQQGGCRPFSHSAPFRAAYAPAYRVVRAAYAPLLPLLQTIETRSAQQPLVVGIDGRCGAGKTTLAALLAPVFDASVLHLDDFFLPPALRSPARLAEPGGNIHYERFCEEALPGLQRHAAFRYRVFDCSVMDYSGWQTMEARRVQIVEGSYALHPRFRAGYDLRVFCDVTREQQRSRILARNGAAQLAVFEQRWIPLEERYFAAYDPAGCCDLLLKL